MLLSAERKHAFHDTTLQYFSFLQKRIYIVRTTMQRMYLVVVVARVSQDFKNAFLKQQFHKFCLPNLTTNLLYY